MRPFLIALSIVCVTAPGGLSAKAEGPRWTPLTGMLSPEGEDPAAKNEPNRTETSSTERPTQPADGTSGADGARLSLKVTLVKAVTDGQPHGSLGVRTIAVDDNLADGLDLAGARGALVTSAPPAGGLVAGDVIEKLDGTEIASADALSAELQRRNPDNEVTVDVWRAGSGPADLKQLLVDRANGGNVGAAASLGRLLSLGLVFGPKNYGEAATYYLKAAEAGHLGSMTRYALFAKDGIGIAKDEALAVKWFREAADGGQDAAMTNLGTLYETGRGVTQDFAEAARWYQKAVDKGHVFAM
ncbi:MAG: PDZ domain-containing protein, partial [Hyphomicrobium sp.]|uniref:tetratricopeptide repeat protein n=1 Tax=Hyphomicrobium sp. TaxID=82 RepID=UPI003D0CA088